MYIVPVPRSLAPHPFDAALTAIGWTFVTELRHEHPASVAGRVHFAGMPTSFSSWYRAPTRDAFLVLPVDAASRARMYTALLNSALISTWQDDALGYLTHRPWPEGGVYPHYVETTELQPLLSAHRDAVAQAVATEGSAPTTLDSAEDVVTVWRLMAYRARCRGAASALTRRQIPKPGKPVTPAHDRWRALTARVPLSQLAALPGAPTPEPDGFGLWAVELPFTPA
jgi:hypothetical protein